MYLHDKIKFEVKIFKHKITLTWQSHGANDQISVKKVTT